MDNNHRNSGLRSSSSSVVSRALQSFMELAEKEEDDDEGFRLMDDDYSIESEWNKLRRASELLQRELNCVDGRGIDFDDSFCNNNNSNNNPNGNEDDEQSSLGWDEIWHNLRRQQSIGSQPQQQQQQTPTTTTTRELTPQKRTLAPTTTAATPRTMARKGSFSSSSARTFHTEEEIRKLQQDLMAGLQEVSQIHAQLVNTRQQDDDDDDTATPDRHSGRRRRRQRERAAAEAINNLVDESTSITTGASTTASLMQGFEQVKEIYAQLMEHSASTQELQDSISSSSFVQEAAPTLSSSVSSSSAATTAATIATSAAMATTTRRTMHDASGYPATESHLNGKNNHDHNNYNASKANSNSCIKRRIQIEGMRELLLLDRKDTEQEPERTLWQRAALFLFGFEDWRIPDPVDRKTAFVLATVLTMALLPKA